MKLFLRIPGIRIPVFMKKKGLLQLFMITADAFGCRVPDLHGLPYRECLRQYAIFTKEQVEKSIQQGSDIQAIKNQLYKNASLLGEKVRNRLSIGKIYDVLFTCKIFYREIGIAFRWNGRGEIIMQECFFSKVYSSDVCHVISSLDEGIISGLTGGARLTFSERITEGATCCKAHLSMVAS